LDQLPIHAGRNDKELALLAVFAPSEEKFEDILQEFSKIT
jgi:hypothetical protein